MVGKACLVLLAVVVCAMPVPAAAATNESILRSLLGKIKHVIVLMEENRSFDHFFGFARKKLGVNGLKGDEFNYINMSNPSEGKVTVSTNAQYVNPCDPNHGTPQTKSKMQGGMGGFVSFEQAAGHGGTGPSGKDWCGVMSSFAVEEIPIITTLAEEFAVMDRMFCSHPGPTWPNRMFALSATSLGSTSTGCFYNNTPGKLFPQPTFFDQVAEQPGMTWKNYYNDTPWELFMESIAYGTERAIPPAFD